MSIKTRAFYFDEEIIKMLLIYFIVTVNHFTTMFSIKIINNVKIITKAYELLTMLSNKSVHFFIDLILHLILHLISNNAYKI